MFLLLVALLSTDPVDVAREPRRVHAPDPEYPPEARAREEEQDIHVQCEVDEAGRVVWARAVSMRAPFTEPAVAAVRRWRYEPGAGHRRFTVRIRFRIPGLPIHGLPATAVLEQARAQDHVAQAAAWREISDRGEAVVAEVVAELGSDDHTRRCTAVIAAGSIGAPARAAASRLLDMVRGDDAGGACWPAAALREVAPDEHEKALKEAVRARDAAGCSALLAGVSPEEDEHAPSSFLEALSVEGCRATAADALTFTEDVGATPYVLRALEAGGGEGRGELLEVLGSLIGRDERAPLQPHLPRILAVLTAALRDDAPGARQAAIQSLEQLGADARPALESIVRALDDADAHVRWRAVATLGALGTAARSAGPALLKMRASAGPGLPPHVARDLDAAIEATRAGKDDTRLAAEDEIRAAVVDHVVGESRRAGREPRFELVVLGESAPDALIAAIARRGVKLPEAGGMRFVLGAVEWKAGDLVHVEVTFDGGMDSSGTTYIVVLDSGRWTVVGTGGGWIT